MLLTILTFVQATFIIKRLSKFHKDKVVTPLQQADPHKIFAGIALQRDAAYAADVEHSLALSGAHKDLILPTANTLP
jgi:hypothetical protein